MKTNAVRKKKGRAVRVTVAIVCTLAMVMTTAISGAAFAAESVDLSNDDGVTLSSDEFTAFQRASDEIDDTGGVNALSPYVDAAGSAPAGNENVEAKGGVSASGNSFPSFNPSKTVTIGDAGNGAKLYSNHAGGSNTVTFWGKNQAPFFSTCNIVDSYTSAGNPVNTPQLGTVAYIPTDYQDGFGHSQGYYSYYDYTFYNDYTFDGPDFKYSGSFTKAAALWVQIYYQKWTVVPNLIQDPSTTAAIQIPDPAQPRKWEADMATRYVQKFNYELLGMLNYYESERGKTFKTAWVTNGAIYPKVTATRSGGFKFNGWYTSWPKGSKVKVGSARVWFGEGYTKTLFVHWKKKVKITYNPSGGKITKGKKTVKVNYLGKVGKAPKASRSGYYGLGWYYITKSKDSYGDTKKSYAKHDKKMIVNVAKATFTAQWIKNGNNKTVSSAEWTRILKAYEKNLLIKYKAVKSAIGGSGTYNGKKKYIIGTVGYTTYYIMVKEYEWNGNLDGTVVKMWFSVSTGNLIDGAKNGGLK